MRNFCDFFEAEIGGQPYKHQKETFEKLSSGKSVILRAPTGSGKTEAATISHYILKKRNWPRKLIYVLPMRSLVEDIANRTRKWWKPDGDFQFHHGASCQDPFFNSSGVTTTIDQVIGAYACAPLSSSLRQGNIPGGAVASAFLVFDEVQLLEPELGLQCTLLLLKHTINSGMPCVLMSATLPEPFVKELLNRFENLELVDAKEGDIPVRKERNVELEWRNNTDLTSTKILEACEESKKIIVIVNRVSKAQSLYKNLKNGLQNTGTEIPAFLLHSRFLPNDRKDKMKALQEIFGREASSDAKGILITTQVVEAGMDISAPLMLTEVAPMDSIIQRAGRCARWKGAGKVIVYDVEMSAPYVQELVKNTREVLGESHTGLQLDWEAEKDLVNYALGEYALQNWLNTEAGGRVVSLFVNASFEGSRTKVEQAIRDALSVEVTIWDQSRPLDNPWSLPYISYPYYSFKSFAEKYRVWEITESNILSDDLNDIWDLREVEEIFPFQHYILHPDSAAYSGELGLELEAEGEVMEPIELEEKRADQDDGDLDYLKESWYLHSTRSLYSAKKLLGKIEFALRALAKKLEVPFEGLKQDLLIAVALHDLGKLTVKWQKKAGGSSENPLAHSENGASPPPHATVSAAALWGYFFKKYSELGIGLEEAFLLAIAHHHTLRTSNFPKYEFINGWTEHLQKSLGDEFKEELRGLIIEKDDAGGRLPTRFVDPQGRNVVYRLYLLSSRVLRLSDQEAVKMLKEEKCPISG